MARLPFLRRLGRRARRRHRGGDDEDSSRSSDSGSDESSWSAEDSSSGSSGTGFSSDSDGSADGSSVNEVTTVTSYSSAEEEDDWSDDEDSDDSELESSVNDSHHGRKRGLRRFQGLFLSRHRRRRRRGAQPRSPLSGGGSQRPEEDAAAAERLRRELEGLGYDLNCNSFITRGSSRNVPLQSSERYRLTDENDSQPQSGDNRKPSRATLFKGLFERNKLCRSDPVVEGNEGDEEDAFEGDVDIQSKATWEGKVIEISADTDGYSTSLLKRSSNRDHGPTGQLLETFLDGKITSSASQATNTSSKLRGRRRKKVKTTVKSKMVDGKKSSSAIKLNTDLKNAADRNIFSSHTKSILKSPAKQELEANGSTEARSPAASKRKDHESKAQRVFFAMSAKRSIGVPDKHDDSAEKMNALSSDGIEEDYEEFLKTLSPRSSKCDRLPPPPPKIYTSPKDTELTQPVIIEGMNIVFARQEIKPGKRNQNTVAELKDMKTKAQVREEKSLLHPFSEPSPLSEPDPNPRRQKFADFYPSVKIALPFFPLKKKQSLKPEQGDTTETARERGEIKDVTDLSYMTGPQMPTKINESDGVRSAIEGADEERAVDPTQLICALPAEALGLSSDDLTKPINETNNIVPPQSLETLDTDPTGPLNAIGVHRGCSLTPNTKLSQQKQDGIKSCAPSQGFNKSNAKLFESVAFHENDEIESDSIEPGQIEVTFDQQLCHSGSDIRRPWSPMKWKQKQLWSPMTTKTESQHRTPAASPPLNMINAVPPPSAPLVVPQFGISIPYEKKSALVKVRNMFAGVRDKSLHPANDNPSKISINTSSNQPTMISFEALSRLSPTTKAKVVEAILMPRGSIQENIDADAFKHLDLELPGKIGPSEWPIDRDDSTHRGLWHDMMEALDLTKQGNVTCASHDLQADRSYLAKDTKQLTDKSLSASSNWMNAKALQNEKVLSVEDASDVEPSENKPPVKMMLTSRKARTFLGMRLGGKNADEAGNVSTNKNVLYPRSHFAVEYNDDNNVFDSRFIKDPLGQKETAENVRAPLKIQNKRIHSTHEEYCKDWEDAALLPKSSTLTTFPASAGRRNSRLPSAFSDDSTYTWTDAADASLALEKVLERINASHSGDDIDESVKLKSFRASVSEDQSVGDIEKALKTLQRHAARLGVSETDILMALESTDTMSMGEHTEKSFKDLTLAQEILHVMSMYMPGAKI